MGSRMLEPASSARTSRRPGQAERWNGLLEQAGARTRLLWVAATAAAGALLFAICERVSATAPITADSANAVLQGHAIASGNVLLHGWTLSRASFLATDLPFDALAAGLRGAAPGAAHDAAAVVFTLLVLSACFLARGSGRDRARGRDAILKVAIPLILLVTPVPGAAAELMLLGPFHVGTTLLLVLALLVIDGAAERLLGIAIIWALLSLAVMSDTLAMYVGVGPLVFVYAARLLGRRPLRWPDVGVLVAALLALPTAAALALAVHWLGGFTTIPLQPGFAGIEDLPRNLALTIEGTLVVFGADFIGQPPGVATLAAVVRLAGLALVAITWWRTVRSGRRGEPVGVIAQVLAVGMAVNLAAYLFSNQAIDLRTSRYLVPLFVFGAVLAGRSGADWPWQSSLRIPASAAVLAYSAVLAISLAAPAAVSPEASVGAFLEQHHLTYGVSGYWEAGTVTVATGGRVRVRAITVDGQGAYPYRWEADDSWYDPSTPGNDARFVLRNTAGRHQLDRQSIEHTFGPPSREYRVGTYEVLVWDRNLLNNLRPPPT
jgi:hypothetical protein